MYFQGFFFSRPKFFRTRVQNQRFEEQATVEGLPVRKKFLLKFFFLVKRFSMTTMLRCFSSSSRCFNFFSLFFFAGFGYFFRPCKLAELMLKHTDAHFYPFIRSAVVRKNNRANVLRDNLFVTLF
jgi:hypothetical protein